MAKNKKQNYELVAETNFNKIKDKVKEIREKTKQERKKTKIIFSSEDDDLNRKVLEKLRESQGIDVLMIPLAGRKDFMKQRNSGFNHILAKEAKKQNIYVGIYLDEILEQKNNVEKSKILARVMQNVFLCNKNKIKMVFISKYFERDIKDLRSLGLVLGMPTWMTKSLEFIKTNK